MKNFLNKKLSEITVKNNIAGMSVAVTNKKEVLYSAGFGFDNCETKITATPNSLYKIASITKVITGITIMKLCQEGILNLNTPVGEYVPWLKLNNDAQNKISLFHLLSHTSGLPAEYTPDGPREESALEESLKKELSQAVLASMPEDNKYLYSNLGIRLASYIAEQKTGISYTQLARKYVINPLDMTCSTFDLHVAATHSLSIPHQEENGILKPVHYISENAARMAAGGLYSNVLDLSKLARCILNNGVNHSSKPIITSLNLQKMMSPVTTQRTNNTEGYGLTFMTNNYKDGVMVGHLGNATPYGAGLFLDTKKGVGAVVLMNTFNNELRTEIPKMILETV